MSLSPHQRNFFLQSYYLTQKSTTAQHVEINVLWNVQLRWDGCLHYSPPLKAQISMWKMGQKYYGNQRWQKTSRKPCFPDTQGRGIHRLASTDLHKIRPEKFQHGGCKGSTKSHTKPKSYWRLAASGKEIVFFNGVTLDLLITFDRTHGQ